MQMAFVGSRDECVNRRVVISAGATARIIPTVPSLAITIERASKAAAKACTSKAWLPILPTAAGISLACVFSLLLAGPMSAAPLVGIGQNFTGSILGVNAFSLPPDSNGAVGPNHFVEFINGRLAVYSKTSGAVVKSLTDITFWRQAGLTFPAGWDVTDPRLVYDPTVQRWFAAEVDFDPSGFINTNRFLLAISASADPTGAWKAVAIPTDPGANNFGDFPTLGLDANGVYLSANLFSASGNAVGSTLLSLPKAGLLLSSPVITNRTWFGVLSLASRGYILQPAVCVDGSAAGHVLATGGLGFDVNTGNLVTNTTLVSCTIQNAAGPGSATLSSSTSIAVPGYTAPLNPFQPDGSDNLDDGDSRFSASVCRVGGVLFAVHGTEVNNLAAIRWYRINAANNLVLESGTITNATLDLFYPSIAANTNGTIVIGFNGSSLSSYVSSYAVVGQTVNGLTTFGSPMLLKAGTASYQDTPGVDPSFYTSRWGDYSATSVDPSDPTTFWTIQMYPSGSDVWSTQITQIFTVPGPVKLTVGMTGANLVVSWPGSAPLLQLQSTTSLTPSAWSPVTQTPVTTDGVTSVQLPANGPEQFFRLISAP
jgi:hypothetical protein